MSQEKMNVQNEAEEMTAEKVNEIFQIRRDKLSALKESGRDPFEEVKYDVTATSKEIVANYTDADEETVMRALKAASFDEKIKHLPNGIHSQLTTEFSKDGVGLSGGESQKIAISRVFARPFELIIMDEPSSALDPVAEYDLNNSILTNAANKTVIFISHRLSTTRMADKIYMLDNGQIIESGSHDELMEQDGKYAKMYRYQAKKYEYEKYFEEMP